MAVLYSDINQLSPATGAKPLLENIESIHQSLRNIILTNKGERLFLPEFGAGLDDLMFEIMDDSIGLTILTKIFHEINRWDPRIRLHTGLSSVDPDYENNAYYMNLVFEIVGLENERFEFAGVLAR